MKNPNGRTEVRTEGTITIIRKYRRPADIEGGGLEREWRQHREIASLSSRNPITKTALPQVLHYLPKKYIDFEYVSNARDAWNWYCQPATQATEIAIAHQLAGIAELAREIHSITPTNKVRPAVPEAIPATPIKYESYVREPIDRLRYYSYILEVVTKLQSRRQTENGESSRHLIHGDMSLQNILLRKEGGVCLIDWERAGLGAVENDLASLTASMLIADLMRNDQQITRNLIWLRIATWERRCKIFLESYGQNNYDHEVFTTLLAERLLIRGAVYASVVHSNRGIATAVSKVATAVLDDKLLGRG